MTIHSHSKIQFYFFLKTKTTAYWPLAKEISNQDFKFYAIFYIFDISEKFLFRNPLIFATQTRTYTAWIKANNRFSVSKPLEFDSNFRQ